MTTDQDRMSEVDNRLMFRFFRTANTLHRQGTGAMEPLGVTTRQWSVLGALSRPSARDGMTVNGLSDYLKISRQNLAGILKRLETAGYLERVPDGNDKRSRRVRMTGRGAKLWEDMGPLIKAFYSGALDGFSDEERTLFIDLVTRLQDNMNRLGQGSPVQTTRRSPT